MGRPHKPIPNGPKRVVPTRHLLHLHSPQAWDEQAVDTLRLVTDINDPQVVNRTEDTVRFLVFSANGEPDIVLYPDSNKLGAFERLPPGAGLRAMFRLSDTVDYHDGERRPR